MTGGVSGDLTGVVTGGRGIDRIVSSMRAVIRVERPEFDAVTRGLRRCANVDDLRRWARRRLPRGVFDYIDGGAEDERTMAANRAAYRDVTFRPRVLRDVSAVDTSSELFGERLAFPYVAAPTGFTRIAHPDGELAVARACERAGVPFVLSTLATRSIEEVRAVSGGRLWFQLYMWRDRGLVRELLDRAREARYEAIQLTVDTAVTGRRERDVRRGFSLPPSIGPGTFLDGLLHPRWTLDLLRSEPIRFANVTGAAVGDGSSAVSLAEYIDGQFDPGLSWEDLDWLRTHWDGPIMVKGIQTVRDAALAAERGVEGIVLSNHGGRQLDGAPATLGLVAPVRDAVGPSATVICDGGVRRGADIVKAVAAGADAVMAGRPQLYGLGAAGERGVDHVLGLLRTDVARTLALLGVVSPGRLDRGFVSLPGER